MLRRVGQERHKKVKSGVGQKPPRQFPPFTSPDFREDNNKTMKCQNCLKELTQKNFRFFTYAMATKSGYEHRCGKNVIDITEEEFNKLVP